MSVRPALTTPENDALNGASVPLWFLMFDTTAYGSEIASAQVDAPVDIDFPTGDIPVKNTSVNWANIQYNDTVFIGTTPGAWDAGIYRHRKTASTSSILRIMYVGENDTGEVALPLRFFQITDGMYITVLRRWDIFGVNPFINYPGSGLDAEIREDFDNNNYQFNEFPPPRVNLFLDDQPNNYGVHVWSGTSKTFDIDFEITLWPTSASVSWAFTLPAGWTLNSGSLTGTTLTGTINVTAPHSATTYALQFDATENHGSVMNCLRKVWIKSFTYPPLQIVKIGTDVDNRTGSTRSITLNQLFDAPPGCMYHMVDMGTWNDTDVPTARKVFTGYLKSRQEITLQGVTNVTLELVSPIYILDLIGGQSQIMSAINTTVTNWQKVNYQLSYIDWIIFYLLMQRASGCVQCFNVTWFGIPNTSIRMTDWRIDAGTIYSQIKAQARRYPGGNFGEDPTGEFMLRRHVSRVPFPDRAAIPVRASLTNSKYVEASLGYYQRPECRRLRTEAFFSDGLTYVTPIWADAVTTGSQGGTDQKDDKLIVDSVGDLLIYTGLEYAARNNPYKQGNAKLARNYAVFFPAQMTRVEYINAPTLTYNGVEYQGYVLPIQVSYTHNEDGTVDPNLQFEAETYGRPGVQVDIPSPDPSTKQSRYQSTPFSRITTARALRQRNGNTNPAGTKNGATSLPKDGSIALGGTRKHAYLVTNILGTVVYKDITPSDIGSYELVHGRDRLGGRGGWLLGNDGTNSVVWYTADLYKSPKPVWSIGTPFSNVYSLIRPDDAVGSMKVLVYAPNQSGSGSVALTYTKGTGPASVNVGDEFTVTSAIDGDAQRVVMGTDVCVHLQVVSYNNWLTIPYGQYNTFPLQGTWTITKGTYVPAGEYISLIYYPGTGLYEAEATFKIDGSGTPFTGIASTLIEGYNAGLWIQGYTRIEAFNSGGSSLGIIFQEGPTNFFLGFSTEATVGGSYSLANISYVTFYTRTASMPSQAWMRGMVQGISTTSPYLWSYKDCALATVNGPAFATDQVPTSFPSMPGVRELQMAGKGSSVYTLRLKVLSKVSAGNTEVRYSSDNGLTFGAAMNLGTGLASLVGGFDTQHNGVVSYAAATGKIKKATSLGGAYSDLLTVTKDVVLIEVPWSTRNSTTVNNTGASPEFIYGLAEPDGSGNTLYWVVGGTPVDITPMISGNPGIPVGPNCLCTWLGTRISYLASFGGVVHEVVSLNGGATWIDRGALDVKYLRLRRQASQPGQLYAVGNTFKYSNTNGATNVTKGLPSDPPLLFIEPVG